MPKVTSINEILNDEGSNKLPAGEYGPITLNGKRVLIGIGVEGDTSYTRTYTTPNTSGWVDTKTGSIPDTLGGPMNYKK